MGIVTQWSVYFAQIRDIKDLNVDLSKAKVDLTHFKNESKKFIDGLSHQIDEQLSSWQLSKAEKDIALLILKGLSNREIGDVRSTSERTVRQQVTSIFQKANISSRLELSAFFLEDLLVSPSSGPNA